MVSASFFVLYKWYRSGRLIPKTPYQLILHIYSVIVVVDELLMNPVNFYVDEPSRLINGQL
jgi:hypothetical protein